MSRKHRENPDPEQQRWARKYPRFPGVAECVRLIKANKAKGTWADIIVYELAAHARECLPELIETFRSDSSRDVQMYVMMALDIARPAEAVPFLTQVLNENDAEFVNFAVQALQGINTREARTALWNAAQVSPRQAESN